MKILWTLVFWINVILLSLLFANYLTGLVLFILDKADFPSMKEYLIEVIEIIILSGITLANYGLVSQRALYVQNFWKTFLAFTVVETVVVHFSELVKGEVDIISVLLILWFGISLVVLGVYAFSNKLWKLKGA